MKILKYLFFTTLALIVVISAFVVIAPNEFTIRETVVIDAPYHMVHRHVAHLRKQHEWNPWNAYDPDQQVEFTGKQDGLPGYRYAWEGPINGKGYQELTRVADNTIEQDLVFTEPWASESKVFFNLNKAPDGVKVDWIMEGSMPAPMNALMLFTDMGMSKDFAAGLQNLKRMIDELHREKVYRGYTINTVTIEPTRMLGIRKTVRMDEMQSFYEQSYQTLYTKLAGQHNGKASGLYYTWDLENQQTEMMPCLMVDETIEDSNEFEEVLLEGEALQIVVNGGYDQLMDVHLAIEEYMKDYSITAKMPAWEEYIIDSNTEKDSSKWLTKVTYLL